MERPERLNFVFYTPFSFLSPFYKTCDARVRSAQGRRAATLHFLFIMDLTAFQVRIYMHIIYVYVFMRVYLHLVELQKCAKVKSLYAKYHVLFSSL